MKLPTNEKASSISKMGKAGIPMIVKVFRCTGAVCSMKVLISLGGGVEVPSNPIP